MEFESQLVGQNNSLHDSIDSEITLQESPPTSLLSSLGSTVRMSILMCLGSHQVVLSLAMCSTTSLREEQLAVTWCLEERATYWMVFREE